MTYPAYVFYIALFIVAALLLAWRWQKKVRSVRPPKTYAQAVQQKKVEPVRPPKTYAQAVRPNQKDRMEPGVEYCWVSFDGNRGQTVTTYYDLTSSRQESFEDRTSFGAMDMQKKLISEGWQMQAMTSHQEGKEYFFERMQSHA